MVCIYAFLTTLLLSVIPPVLATSTIIDLPIEEDTYVEEKFPTISPWNNRNLFLGTDGWYSKGKNRILIKPNFSTLQNQDILYTDIEKVELLLTEYEYEGADNAATIDTYTTTSPWSMFSVTWSLQPTISTKKDSTVVTTQFGEKTISATNAFIEAYKAYPSTVKGILLKINAETEKAIIFWAHGCDIAPAPPICAGSHERPHFRITLKMNHLPTSCSLKSPANMQITNNPSIAIEVNPSSDEDGNTVSYFGRVCREPSCDTPLWQNQIIFGTKSYSELTDGRYYLSCSAQDGHSDYKWGNPVEIVVDTVPPTASVLLEEPPFTGTRDNQIVWIPNLSEEVEYQAESSERSDFRSYNIYSPWIRENHYTFSNTKEKTFYYRTKSRDKAGNESVWSNVSSTVIDSTTPIVRYFKANKSLLSPKVSTKGEVTENAYIQGGGDDATIDTITLEISNSLSKTVYSESVSGKSYLWTHWPEKAGYPDGIYSARIVITDSINHIAQSDGLILILDTKAPPSPIISGLVDKQLLNKSTISFSVSCKENSQGTIYLGGKIVGSGKTNFTITTKQSDGAHTLSATCTDFAGNKSEKTISFTVDTTAPSPPSISYSVTNDTKKLQIKIYCREEGKVELYLRGVLRTSEDCKKNTYFTYTEAKAIILPYYDTFTARIFDKAGNKSDLTEKTIYLDSNDATPKQRTCSAVYDMHIASFSQINCNWEQDDVYYKKTETFKNSRYKSSFKLNSNRLAKVQLTVFNCKSKSLWDPRTWTSCVREVVSEVTTDGKITPVLTSTDEIEVENNSEFALYHPKKETISIRKQYLLQFSTFLGANSLHAETLSQQIQDNFTPIYTGTSSKGYFSWIFSGTEKVSQWHGNTAYQKPHGGIDFSVSHSKIIAPANGTVVSVGYDQKNSCFSGGNYFGLIHSNGLYSYYFHLASTKYPNGNLIKKGDKVTTNQFLATTGSSGYYNCEPLAAHLHFELRKSAKASSHTNPVPYFSIDWNKIVTANAIKFPGRLTGDNPHPKF